MEAISIVQRPKTWDEIIGQDRALRVLKDILRNGKFAPRAIILEGPYGVGKTTTGYITAKALMCIGDNKLGCGVCASCLVFQEHADAHPEFREVDAASHSGVGETRKLVEEAMELPTLSKTRVILIDEAHRLSGEAWDVYLKPLEQIDTKAVFIFATTDAKRIPAKIRSRCVVIRFSRVALDIMTGYLVSIASKMQLDYELDGLKLLARAAKGHIRSALILLDKVSAMGKVTKELAASVVDTSYSDMALNVLIHLATDRFDQALITLDEMALSQPVSKAITEIFSAYGRAVFGDGDLTPEEIKRYTAVKAHFPQHSRVTEVLIKWSSADRIPTDALPLFAHELYTLRATEEAPVATSPRVSRSHTAVPAATATTSSLTAVDLAKSLGATIVSKQRGAT